MRSNMQSKNPALREKTVRTLEDIFSITHSAEGPLLQKPANSRRLPDLGLELLEYYLDINKLGLGDLSRKLLRTTPWPKRKCAETKG